MIRHTKLRIKKRRFLDYCELMKPELTGLSVLTTLCAFYMASDGAIVLLKLAWLGIGTLMVGGGAGALNQYFEREYDGMMKRTERRPLPAGRMRPVEVFLFGSSISLGGLIVLSCTTGILSGFIAALTLITYLFVYTPLKRISWWNTIVGAVPGSLPILIGWAAARNEITIEAWLLFGILFAWQMPHFFSLAWMYRRDYARAGFKMLSVLDDEKASKTSLQILFYCLGLITLTIAFSFTGLTGYLYLYGAIVAGISFTSLSLLLTRSAHRNSEIVEVNRSSRRIFFASLAYLPILMVLMVLDKV